MQNSTCPTWRALERYRRDPAVQRHWVCTRLGIPDHHAGVQKSLLGFSNSPVTLHWFTASESIMSPVGVTRLLPQLQGSGMPAKQQLSHKWDFPFFFFQPHACCIDYTQNLWQSVGEVQETRQPGKQGSQNPKEIWQSSEQWRISEMEHIHILSKDSKAENSRSHCPREDLCKNPEVMVQLC